jgi:hypothetical protein
MSKIPIYMLLTGLVTGIAGIAFFLYGMNSEQSEIPVASISESMNSDENISSQGIKVRGDWEVTVSDPEGSNPTVYNFRNEIHEDALDVVSRSLLPADQDQSAYVTVWKMMLAEKIVGGGGFTIICYLATDPEFSNSGVTYDQLLARLIPKDGLDVADWALESKGLRLTGSCLPRPDIDYGDEITIQLIKVGANFHVNDPTQGATPANPIGEGYGWDTWAFASKEFTEENALVVGSSGQMIAVTVDFTFE